MSAQMKDVRRARLERLAERAQRAREVARQARLNPIASARARMTAIAASLSLLAFANTANESAAQQAADDVEVAIGPIAEAIASAQWDVASGAIPALVRALKAWATTAGVDYKSPTDGPSPSQLVASLQDALEKQNAADASSAIEAIRESFDPGDEPSAVVAAANRARRHGAVSAGGNTLFGIHLERVDGQIVGLTASELQACEVMGAKPEDFTRNKLIRERTARAQRSKTIR